MVIFIIGSKGNKFFNLVKRLIMGISRIFEKTLLRNFIPCLLIQLILHHLIVHLRSFYFSSRILHVKKTLYLIPNVKDFVYNFYVCV